MGRNLVFRPGPHFIPIARWDVGTPPVRLGEIEQTRIVAVREDALLRYSILETLSHAVVDDRPQCRPNMVFRQDVPEIELMGPPLAGELIGQTPGAILLPGRRLRVLDLNVVLAVPEQRIVGGARRQEPLVERSPSTSSPASRASSSPARSAASHKPPMNLFGR